MDVWILHHVKIITVMDNQIDRQLMSNENSDKTFPSTHKFENL